MSVSSSSSSSSPAIMEDDTMVEPVVSLTTSMNVSQPEILPSSSSSSSSSSPAVPPKTTPTTPTTTAATGDSTTRTTNPRDPDILDRNKGSTICTGSDRNEESVGVVDKCKKVKRPGRKGCLYVHKAALQMIETPKLQPYDALVQVGCSPEEASNRMKQNNVRMKKTRLKQKQTTPTKKRKKLLDTEIGRAHV